MKKSLRFLLRCFKILVAVALLCVVIVVTVNLWDASLEPDADAYFTVEDSLAVDSNAFLAVVGLGAPEGEDIYEYGKIWLQKRRASVKETEPVLQFKGDAGTLHCYTYEKKEDYPCASESEVRKMLEDNRLLFSRYLSLHRYQRFVQTDLGGVSNLIPVMHANRLLLAELLLKTKQDQFDKVFETWHNDTAFWQRALKSQHMLVAKSILLVIYNRNLRFLSKLLDSGISLAPEQKNQLTALLQPNGIQDYDPEGLTKTEIRKVGLLFINAVRKQCDFQFSIDCLFYQPNASRNKLIYFAKDMIALSHKSAEQFAADHQAVHNKYGAEVAKS